MKLRFFPLEGRSPAQKTVFHFLGNMVHFRFSQDHSLFRCRDRTADSDQEWDFLFRLDWFFLYMPGHVSVQKLSDYAVLADVFKSIGLLSQYFIPQTDGPGVFESIALQRQGTVVAVTPGSVVDRIDTGRGSGLIQESKVRECLCSRS